MALTYEPITTTTVSGASVSTITLSGIPSTYTDLKLVVVGWNSSQSKIRLQFNGDTTSVYSRTAITGDGVNSPSKTTSSNQAFIDTVNNVLPDSSVVYGMTIFDIMGYAGSMFKTVLYKAAAERGTQGISEFGQGEWKSTAAISSITLSTPNALWKYQVGTRVTLYGIKAA